MLRATSWPPPWVTGQKHSGPMTQGDLKAQHSAEGVRLLLLCLEANTIQDRAAGASSDAASSRCLCSALLRAWWEPLQSQTAASHHQKVPLWNQENTVIKGLDSFVR